MADVFNGVEKIVGDCVKEKMDEGGEKELINVCECSCVLVSHDIKHVCV